MRFLLTLVIFLGLAEAGHAQELVHFLSLDGPPATELDGYLFPAEGQERHPAAVFLPGCGGLLSRQTGAINSRERDWAARLNALGITVLMVDSLNPRHHGEMCAPAHFDPAIYRARPLDAYGALRYLQTRDFIQPDRIALVGWSQGGGTVLNTIHATHHVDVPLPAGDFRAAVAFYPASCNTRRQGAVWSSTVPLLVLNGESDVWTPAAPCRTLIESASSGTSATIQTYPGAYHDFDWPNMHIHEVPAFTTTDGVVPIEGTDTPAREDALQRVPEFLKSYLQTP